MVSCVTLFIAHTCRQAQTDPQGTALRRLKEEFFAHPWNHEQLVGGATRRGPGPMSGVLPSQQVQAHGVFPQPPPPHFQPQVPAVPPRHFPQRDMRRDPRCSTNYTHSFNSNNHPQARLCDPLHSGGCPPNGYSGHDSRAPGAPALCASLGPERPPEPEPWTVAFLAAVRKHGMDLVFPSLLHDKVSSCRRIRITIRIC